MHAQAPCPCVTTKIPRALWGLRVAQHVHLLAHPVPCCPAPLIRFGDRRFYEDWWNARSFASYYRKWNMVVHEFLFYYMYQDAIR